MRDLHLGRLDAQGFQSIRRPARMPSEVPGPGPQVTMAQPTWQQACLATMHDPALGACFWVGLVALLGLQFHRAGSGPSARYTWCRTDAAHLYLQDSIG